MENWERNRAQQIRNCSEIPSDISPKNIGGKFKQPVWVMKSNSGLKQAKLVLI